MSGDFTPDELLVNGWSPRFARAVSVLLRTEGGHVNDPVDRGGETKYGISLRFLVSAGQIDLDADGVADFDLDMDGDIDGADIRRLTPHDAKFVYHRCFWKPLDADAWAAPIGEAMFDQAVNGGLVAAKKLLQRAINACLARAAAADRPAPLAVDGTLGAATRAAFAWVLRYPGLGMAALILAYRQAAADRYRAIVAAAPSQKRFLRGWLRRAAELGRS